MNDSFKAKIWRLGDDIDTDIILPTEYLAYKTVDDMKPYAFSPLRPDLASKIQPGDMIVAGNNFGCGSSREQAPEVVKALGVSCIVAKSFARIFFRNAINNGLLLIENPILFDEVKEGDVAEVKPGQELIIDPYEVKPGQYISVNDKEYKITSLPDNLIEILQAGGLVKAMRKRNGLE